MTKVTYIFWPSNNNSHTLHTHTFDNNVSRVYFVFVLVNIYALEQKLQWNNPTSTIIQQQIYRTHTHTCIYEKKNERKNWK